MNQLNGNNFCTSDCSNAGCPQGFECSEIDDINYAQICIPTAAGGAPDVIISEILYDSPGKDTEVFVELKGAPNTILDGLVLAGVNGSTGSVYGVVAVYGYIGADGYFVIAHPNASAELLASAEWSPEG